MIQVYFFIPYLYLLNTGNALNATNAELKDPRVDMWVSDNGEKTAITLMRPVSVCKVSRQWMTECPCLLCFLLYSIIQDSKVSSNRAALWTWEVGDGLILSFSLWTCYYSANFWCRGMGRVLRGIVSLPRICKGSARRDQMAWSKVGNGQVKQKQLRAQRAKDKHTGQRQVSWFYKDKDQTKARIKWCILRLRQASRSGSRVRTSMMMPGALAGKLPQFSGGCHHS